MTNSKISNKPLRCAGYIRVSTEKDDQKTSIENQISLFEQECQERGWEIAETYIDIQSGTTPNRHNLQRMLTDMSKNKFDIILAKELSRLSRNGALSYAIRDSALQYNIKIITLDGAINMLENSLDMFGIYTWLYEHEAQQTSNRVKHSLSTQAKQGKFMGSTPPYGYFSDNKTLKIRSDQSASVVKRIYNEYLEGKGFDRIAKDLTEDNIPTPSELLGKKNFSPYWQGSSVRKILENRHYIGHLVQGRETTINVTNKKRRQVGDDELIIVENTHEPIIPKEIFFAVQALMHQRKKSPCSPQTRIFSNLLFCMDCGKGLHYRESRKGYVCGTYGKKGVQHCSSHLIKEEILKAALLSEINNILKSTTISYNILLKLDVEKKQIEKRVAYLEKRLQQIKKSNNLALTKMLEGSISEAAYKAYVSSDDQNTVTVEQELSYSQQLLNKLSSPLFLDQLSDVVVQRAITTLDSTVLNMFISKIEVGQKDHVRIHYKFDTNIFSTYNIKR